MTTNLLSVFLVSIALWSSAVRAEMFTSIMDMERALHAEHEIAQDLRGYIGQERGRLDRLEKIAQDFEEHSENALKNPEKHLSNPLNAFLLIKRFSMGWEKIVDEYILGNYSAEFMASISSKTCNFPDKDDLGGAAVGLHRLQDTYALPTSTLAKGELQGITDSPELTADDCFELGRVAYNQGDHYHAILWMTESLERLNDEVNATTNRATLLDYLAYSLYVKGNINHARNLTLQWLEIEPNHPRAEKNIFHYDKTIADEKEKKKGDAGEEKSCEDEDPSVVKNWKVPADEYRGSEAFLSYERLCRGEPTEAYKYANRLTCQYRRHHPIFYLSPALEETVNLNPHMYMYHRVMTDSEIAKVIELSMPKLHRSGVFVLNQEDSHLSRYRTSKSAWINDSEHPLILRLSVKTGVLANLTRDTVEQLQVLNYGIGGHYEPHYDFARDNEISTFDTTVGNRIATTMFYNTEITTFTDATGNRIATTIFYMTDVAAGGCTVFPEVGVRICPERGSMAVWYNLHLNGNGNYMTRHAACPVLSGNKWVATKWYHAIGNEFTRKCSLNPNE